MRWNAPAALAGLVLLLGPILVHLLARSRARRVVFPSIRFVPAVRAAAIRLHRPSDAALLFLRVGIVAAAMLAAAQPVFVTAARERAWSARVARAIVLDTSSSVDRESALGLANTESADAFLTQTIASADLGEGIVRASDWLADAPAGTREIVVVSDFQAGSLSAAEVARLPASVGVRFVRAARADLAAGSLAASDGWRGGRWMPSLSLDAGATLVHWERRDEAAYDAVVVRAAPADMAAAERAARAAWSFGVPALDPGRQIEVRFAGAPGTGGAPPTTAWIAAAAMSLQQSALLAAARIDIVARERDGRLIVETTVPATSLLAPSVVRATLLAAAPAVVDREREPVVIDDATLAAWRRDAAPSPIPAPRDVTDGRWLWVIAAALLGVEAVLRRRNATAVRDEVHADAA